MVKFTRNKTILLVLGLVLLGFSVFHFGGFQQTILSRDINIKQLTDSCYATVESQDELSEVQVELYSKREATKQPHQADRLTQYVDIPDVFDNAGLVSLTYYHQVSGEGSLNSVQKPNIVVIRGDGSSYNMGQLAPLSIITNKDLGEIKGTFSPSLRLAPLEKGGQLILQLEGHRGTGNEFKVGMCNTAGKDDLGTNYITESNEFPVRATDWDMRMVLTADISDSDGDGIQNEFDRCPKTTDRTGLSSFGCGRDEVVYAEMCNVSGYTPYFPAEGGSFCRKIIENMVEETVNVCEEGSLSNDETECIVNPPVNETCEVGTITDDKTQCVVEPPIQKVCEVGSLNDDQTACIFNPEIEKVCLEGTLDDNGRCEVNPDLNRVCPAGFTLEQEDSNTYVCTTTPEEVCEGGEFNDEGKCVKPILAEYDREDILAGVSGILGTMLTLVSLAGSALLKRYGL